MVMVLLPQIVLGVVAFGAAGQRQWWVRLMGVTTGPMLVSLALAARGRWSPGRSPRARDEFDT
jgi:hypothetical protein